MQLSVYGRVLRGEPDTLVDWVRTRIGVPKRHKAALSGIAYYANVESSPGSGSHVAGTLLELTNAELTATDGYEQDADYVRVIATLASGRNAWVYVSASTVSNIGR